MRTGSLMMLLSAASQWCCADISVVAPTPGLPAVDSFSSIPFLKVAPDTMRFQQVYSASLFSNVPAECIYVTSVGFSQDESVQGKRFWTVTNMQINFSTTQRQVDGLRTNFAGNVGADDTIVFGPGPHLFDDSLGEGFPILFDQPFRYNPAVGNLLMDVRIFTGTSPFQQGFPPPLLDAQNSPTDEVSVVYATNVTAANATSVDTTGLFGGIRFSAVPSLQIQIESVFGTNRPVVRWPAQPSVFVLQKSPQLGSNALWQTITNGIGGDDRGPDRWIYLPVPPPGPASWYRLIWESGQPVQPAAIPIAPPKTNESLPR